MDIDFTKEYIRRYVNQGISLENVYAVLALSEDQISEVRQDEGFIQECKASLSENTLDKLQTYNDRVDASVQPSDHAKRLGIIAPEIFEEKPSTVIHGDLIIKRVRDDRPQEK